MTGVLAIPTGGRRLTHCCDRHHPGPIGVCCEQETCRGCCPECVTCPRVAFFEAYQPGTGREAARAHERWFVEHFGDRLAMARIAAALAWWDAAEPRRFFSVRPQVARIVRLHQAVQKTRWAEVF